MKVRAPAARLRSWFELAALFASDDMFTPIICGVLADADEGHLRLTATDKYVAAVVSTDLPCSGAAGSFILPLEAVLAACSMVGGKDVGLSLGHGRAVWRMPNGDRFGHQLIRGTYPDVPSLMKAPDPLPDPRPAVSLGSPLRKLADAFDKVSVLNGPQPVRMDMAGDAFSAVRFTIGSRVTGAVMPVLSR